MHLGKWNCLERPRRSVYNLDCRVRCFKLSMEAYIFEELAAAYRAFGWNEKRACIRDCTVGRGRSCGNSVYSFKDVGITATHTLVRLNPNVSQTQNVSTDCGLSTRVLECVWGCISTLGPPGITFFFVGQMY